MLLKLKRFCLIDNTISKWSGCKQVRGWKQMQRRTEVNWIFFSTCISLILQWPMPFLPMKYPEYRISMEAALPSSVHCWFKHELELLGIDSLIYTRYIISLLLQVCCFSKNHRALVWKKKDQFAHYVFSCKECLMIIEFIFKKYIMEANFLLTHITVFSNFLLFDFDWSFSLNIFIPKDLFSCTNIYDTYNVYSRKG